jgi:hypothetical protein
MAKLIPADLTFSEVGHLPIIKEFAKKIKLVETLNAMVDSQMELAPGVTVMAMVLDTLSGRLVSFHPAHCSICKRFFDISPLASVC